MSKNIASLQIQNNAIVQKSVREKFLNKFRRMQFLTRIVTKSLSLKKNHLDITTYNHRLSEFVWTLPSSVSVFNIKMILILNSYV